MNVHNGENNVTSCPPWNSFRLPVKTLRGLRKNYKRKKGKASPLREKYTMKEQKVMVEAQEFSLMVHNLVHLKTASIPSRIM